MDTAIVSSHANQAAAFHDEAVHTLVDMEASSAKISLARGLVRDVKSFRDGRLSFEDLAAVYTTFITAR